MVMINDRRGGPIATPIREMLDSKYDGVIFDCDDPRSASMTRIVALTFKKRNGYEYKTTQRENCVKVYKAGEKWDFSRSFHVDLRKEV